MYLFSIIAVENQVEVIEEAILAPPQSSGEHQAYIPMDYAKECIQKVISRINPTGKIAKK